MKVGQVVMRIAELNCVGDKMTIVQDCCTFAANPAPNAADQGVGGTGYGWPGPGVDAHGVDVRWRGFD